MKKDGSHEQYVLGTRAVSTVYVVFNIFSSCNFLASVNSHFDDIKRYSSTLAKRYKLIITNICEYLAVSLGVK